SDERLADIESADLSRRLRDLDSQVARTWRDLEHPRAGSRSLRHFLRRNLESSHRLVAARVLRIPGRNDPLHRHPFVSFLLCSHRILLVLRLLVLRLTIVTIR